MLAGCTQSHEIGTWTGNDFLQIFTSKQIIFVAFLHNGFDEEAKSNQKQEKKRKKKRRKKKRRRHRSPSASASPAESFVYWPRKTRGRRGGGFNGVPTPSRWISSPSSGMTVLTDRNELLDDASINHHRKRRIFPCFFFTFFFWFRCGMLFCCCCWWPPRYGGAKYKRPFRATNHVGASASRQVDAKKKQKKSFLRRP